MSDQDYLRNKILTYRRIAEDHRGLAEKYSHLADLEIKEKERLEQGEQERQGNKKRHPRPFSKKLKKVVPQVADVSLKQQIYIIIRKAGSGGVLCKDVYARIPDARQKSIRGILSREALKVDGLWTKTKGTNGTYIAK